MARPLLGSISLIAEIEGTGGDVGWCDDIAEIPSAAPIIVSASCSAAIYTVERIGASGMGAGAAVEEVREIGIDKPVGAGCDFPSIKFRVGVFRYQTGVTCGGVNREAHVGFGCGQGFAPPCAYAGPPQRRGGDVRVTFLYRLTE